jgi:PHD/YefM family antitoxin component YafN of YafNO toxin-antitoxin module
MSKKSITLTEYDSMAETLYLLGNANNARHLAESIAQLKAGGGAVRQFLKGRKNGGTHVK